MKQYLITYKTPDGQQECIQHADSIGMAMVEFRRLDPQREIVMCCTYTENEK